MANEFVARNGLIAQNNSQFTGSITQGAYTASFGGNVGIGTTTPTYKLHITGSGTSGSFNADNVLYVSGSNVGIGTTSITDPQGYGSPILQISGTNFGVLSLRNTGGSAINWQIANERGTYKIVNGTASTAFSILAAGNVGIGTTSPTAAGLQIAKNGAASVSGVLSEGTWFTGGTATTTKPQLLIEPSGSTSTAWSTSGTGLGINASASFAGNLINAQVNGSSQFKVDFDGAVTAAGGNGGVSYYLPGNNAIRTSTAGNMYLDTNNGSVVLRAAAGAGLTEGLRVISNGNVLVNSSTDTGYKLLVSGSGVSGSFNANNVLYVSGSRVGIGTSTPNAKLDVSGSAIISGSLTVTQGITGSITSASYATVAQTLLGSITSASYADTASYATVAQTLLGSVVSASYAATASLSNGVTGGITGYLPKWNGNTLVTSSIYANGNGFTAIGYSGSPEDPSNPETLYVHNTLNSSFNLISAHGDTNNYTQINIKNYNAGVSASADIVATADNGNESTKFIDMGINSSGFIQSSLVGTANDAYIYSTGNDLLIGNATPNKKVIIFNGGTDSSANARVYIDDNGTVGINTIAVTAGNPEALLVEAISATTYNLISARSNVDTYTQFNIKNINSGNNASTDIVVTNDEGSETHGYANFGINSTTYNVANAVGGAGDAYLYSKGHHFHIGNASTSSFGDLFFFTGGSNTDSGSRMIIKNTGLIGIGNMNPTYSLDISGSTRIIGNLMITGSLIVPSITGSLLGTASYATVAQTLLGSVVSASYASVAQTLLGSVVSASFSAQATSASYASVAQTLLGSVVSASYAATASRVISASYATVAQNVLGSITSASYAAQATSASYATVAQTLLGSVVSASYAATASQATSASYALSASWAPGGAGGYSFTNTNNITAAGTTQGTATPLTTKINTITTTAAGTGVILPSATVSDRLTVVNHGLNTLNVYPASGETVEGLAINVPFPLLPGQCYNIGVSTAGAWDGIDVNIWDDENSSIIISSIINEPPAPPTSSLKIYSKNIAGRQMPKWIGPSGVDTPFQPNIAFNQVSLIGPGGGTTVGVIGCTVTSVGTISNPNIAVTNLKTQTRRIVNTTAAGAGSLASTRVAALECWRGNVASQGGFFSVARFGFTTLQTGQRMFIGLDSNATAAPTNIDYATSTTTAKIGMYATGSTGNWSLINNTAAAVPTVLPLGASFPIDTTSLLEMILFAKPNDTVVTYRITNLSTNAAVSGSLASNLPSSTTPLGRLIAGCNNLTAAAMAWDVSRFSLETDY